MSDRFLTFLERVKQAQALWAFAIPEIPQPPNGTWCRWLTASTDSEVEKTILRVPTRFRDVKPTHDEVYRFVTAMLVLERKRRTQKVAQRSNEQVQQQGTTSTTNSPSSAVRGTSECRD